MCHRQHIRSNGRRLTMQRRCTAIGQTCKASGSHADDRGDDDLDDDENNNNNDDEIDDYTQGCSSETRRLRSMHCKAFVIFMLQMPGLIRILQDGTLSECPYSHVRPTLYERIHSYIRQSTHLSVHPSFRVGPIVLHD